MRQEGKSGKKAVGKLKKYNFKNDRELQEKLMNSRVVQRDLLYIIGLSPRIASRAVLAKPEYLGQYGQIIKVVVNNSKPYNAVGSVGPCYSAYVTYSSTKEATIALLAIDQFMYDDRLIRGSFGTTKYCTHFLNDEVCNNPECLYLHSITEGADTITKEDLSNNKAIFLQQQKEAFYSHHIDQMTKKDLEQLVGRFKPKKTSEFPPAEYIFSKQFAFLGGTLSDIQKKPVVPKRVTDVIHKDKNKEELLDNKAAENTKTQAVPESKGVATKNKQKKKKKEGVTSRFGVPLEDKGQDSDGSIIIPEELEEMLSASLKGESRIPNDELLNQIDGISLSKRESSAINVNCRWVDDLLKQDSGMCPKASSSSKLPCFSKGPLLITEADIIRVSTPLRERYNRGYRSNEERKNKSTGCSISTEKTEYTTTEIKKTESEERGKQTSGHTEWLTTENGRRKQTKAKKKQAKKQA